MLLSFRFANHRSFRESQELSLPPVYKREDDERPALPIAAIFGANASGKTNVLDAFQFMREAVLDSFGRWQRGSGVPRVPFVPDGEEGPSEYDIEVEIGGVCYRYAFVIDSVQVLHESLVYRPLGRRRLIFERHRDQLRVGATSGEIRRIARGLMVPDALLLSVLGQAGSTDAQPLFRWFSGCVEVIGRGRGGEVVPAMSEETVERIDALMKHPLKGNALLELVKAADLGIENLRVTRGISPSLGGRSMTLLYTRQVGGDFVELGAPDESQGVLAWTVLAVHVLTALEKGSLLIVDDLDRSLHPLLLISLIEMFRKQRTNPRRAQLLFSTHQSAMLGVYFDVPALERDEIWLTQKSRNGDSALYPLTAFRPVRNDPHERRYLYGQYEGVPLLSDFRFDDAVEALMGSGG